MKKLSLVFFIYFENNKKFILLGRQAPNKRLAGIRNGSGGKCEGNESTEDCAVRETKEEFGIQIKKEELVLVGKIVDETMVVDVFIVLTKEKFNPPADNNEFVDVRWFALEQPELFVPEMLPNNDVIIPELKAKIDELKANGKVLTTFVVDETKVDSPELKSLKSKIYK